VTTKPSFSVRETHSSCQTRNAEHQLTQSARAPDTARIGAVFFLHHFGSSLNVHLYFHVAICDGVFYKAGDQLHFAEANVTAVDIAQVQEQFRKRILALFVRRGLLDKAAAQSMAQWSHGGGFSINGAVRIDAFERRGLERLLRYCARPLYAAGRLQWIVPGERLRYRPAKPGPFGETELILTPFEFIDRITQLMPAPRRHRHRYFGVFAPKCTAAQAGQGLRRFAHRQASTGENSRIQSQGSRSGRLRQSPGHAAGAYL